MNISAVPPLVKQPLTDTEGTRRGHGGDTEGTGRGQGGDTEGTRRGHGGDTEGTRWGHGGDTELLAVEDHLYV